MYNGISKKTGYTEPGLFGGYNSYDAKGKKVGHSDPGLFGGYTHRDFNTGKQNTTASHRQSDSQGCYVATCVYGSYDCPQVWTLRRFRDNTLAETIPGRAFIHTYYAISPTIVKWFGKTEWFKKMWRGVLNNMVQRLNNSGVENTPYNDRDWK